MGLSLRGTTSGAVDINAPAIAGDNTITLPNGNGSANQFFKNSDTAGIITHSSMTESSSGVISIGDIDIDGTTRTITTGVGQTVGFSTDIKIQGSVRIEDPSVSASRLAITYQGIDFQNTGAGSSTGASAHTLDDYEEGTFTPFFINVAAPTYSNQNGSYIKVGNLVNYTLVIDYSSLTSDASSMAIGGLPFLSATVASGAVAGGGNISGGNNVDFYNGSATTGVCISVSPNNNILVLLGLGDSNTFDYSNCNATGTVRVTGCYISA